MIKIEGLSKTYENEILRDVNVEINKGDVISIIGPSGCGKSTFLRCINMLETPTSGKIFIDGQEITSADKKELARLRQKMGMVFQYYNLFAHMTIIENIMLGPVNLLGVDRQTAYDEGMALLESMGLTSRALHYPDALSGGQKQRAAIARTLAMKPEVVLLDEPTSALDPRMIGEVLAVIKRMADSGMTMLIVTHEMSFAENVANRVFYMDEKGIYEDGTPEQIFHHPLKPKTKEFIYQIRAFNYEIPKTGFDFYEFLGQMSNFMKNQLLDDAKVNRCILLCEEIIYNLLFKALPDDASMHFTMTYSEKLKTMKFGFASPYIKENLPDSVSYDEISAKIVEKQASSLKFEDGKLMAEIKFNLV